MEAQKRMVNPYKVIDETKHPAAHWDAGMKARVFLNQALIEAAWTPKQTGYYRLEVELEPARQHTLLEGFATRLIAVSENVGAPKKDR